MLFRSALLAQGMEAFRAASVGAYIHGRAGEEVTARIGEHACTAGDLAQLGAFSRGGTFFGDSFI